MDIENLINEFDLQPIYNEIASYQIKNGLASLSNELQQIYFAALTYQKVVENYLLYKRKTKKRKEEYQNIQLFGTKFLFKLREFLTGEQIQFLVGSIDLEGNLVEKIYSQDEIFNNITKTLRSSLSESAVVLRGQLENAKNLNQVSSNLVEMWRKILLYGTNESFEKVSKSPQTEIIPWRSDQNKFRHIYRNPQLDTNVFIGFAGSQRIYYYDKGKEYFYYNRGWLYENFSALKEDDDFMYNLWFSLNEGSISPLINSITRDRVKGVQSGDIILNNQQTQVKYNNNQIISFTNIKNTIEIIIKALKDYITILKGGEGSREEIIQKIKQLFSTEVQKTNLQANKKINEMLSGLIK